MGISFLLTLLWRPSLTGESPVGDGATTAGSTYQDSKLQFQRIHTCRLVRQSCVRVFQDVVGVRGQRGIGVIRKSRAGQSEVQKCCPIREVGPGADPIQ